MQPRGFLIHPQFSQTRDLKMKAVLKKILTKQTRILLRKYYYYGHEFSCNVCSNTLRTMLTIGYNFPVLKELDVIGGETISFDTCPVCFANSRTRMLFSYLENDIGIANLKSMTKILHIAPEYGILARLRANRSLDYLPVDINPRSYSDIGGVAYCDITAINHSEDSFDLIICSHVLEHIPDDRLAMRELFRVLKPGGRAIVQVPVGATLLSTIEDPWLSDPRERERRFGQHDHVRIYGADYTGRLQEAGFLVETFDPSSYWGSAMVNKLRLNPREKLFLGRK
jgi:SAM-dependent methyltransferase